MRAQRISRRFNILSVELPEAARYCEEPFNFEGCIIVDSPAYCRYSESAEEGLYP